MKLYLLPLLLFLVHTAHTQTRDGNKTGQVEQLQQLKQAVSHKIDTLHQQLMKQADSIAGIRKKLDQLKKENNNPARPEMVASNGQTGRSSQDLLTMTNLANNLQKKLEGRLVSLNKAVNLQKDLEDKINALLREANR